MNSAAHSAITRVSNRKRAPGSTLRMIANMPPIQDTSGARKNEIEIAPSAQSVRPWALSAGNRESTSPIGDGGARSARPSLIADSTTSVSTESATMAERSHARARAHEECRNGDRDDEPRDQRVDAIRIEDRRRDRIQKLDDAANEGQHEGPADEGG